MILSLQNMTHRRRRGSTQRLQQSSDDILKLICFYLILEACAAAAMPRHMLAATHCCHNLDKPCRYNCGVDLCYQHPEISMIVFPSQELDSQILSKFYADCK